MSLPAQPNYIIEISHVPNGFNGTLDDFTDFLEANLVVELAPGFFFVGVGTTLPSSNVGPFLLLPANLWYVWDDTTARYILQSGITQIGQEVTFANVSTSPPDNTKWAREDGRAVPRTAPFDKLFALLGTTYGSGDGSTTFNLPTMPDIVDSGSIHHHYYIRYA